MTAYRPVHLCKFCSTWTCFKFYCKFYCMFYCSCDHSISDRRVQQHDVAGRVRAVRCECVCGQCHGNATIPTAIITTGARSYPDLHTSSPGESPKCQPLCTSRNDVTQLERWRDRSVSGRRTALTDFRCPRVLTQLRSSQKFNYPLSSSRHCSLKARRQQ